VLLIPLSLGNINKHLAGISTLDSLDSSFKRLSSVIAAGIKNMGKLLLCGNGGLATDPQCLAAKFTGRLLRDRRVYQCLL
jgi:phosphoheptose isomerase